MAQGFDDFEGADVGTTPSNLEVFGSTTVKVEEDPDALNGKVLRMSRDLGGGDRGVRFLDGPVVDGGVNPRHMYSRFRLEGGNPVINLRMSEPDNVTGRAFYTVRLDEVTFSTRSTRHADALHGLDATNYINVYAELDDGAGTIWVWVGSPSEPPATPLFSGSGSSDAEYYGRIELHVGGDSGDKLFLDRYGWGTDGDPAPTGPVSAGPTTPTNLTTTNITANSFRAGWTP